MVFNDINESNLYFKYHEFTFYFSSTFYYKKFVNEYINFLKNETIKLKNKYKCNISCNEFLLIYLYKKIEKRGFRVYFKDKILKETNEFEFKIKR